LPISNADAGYKERQSPHREEWTEGQENLPSLKLLLVVSATDCQNPLSFLNSFLSSPGSSRAISGVMFRVQTRYNWVTSLLLEKDGEVEIWCKLQDQFAMRHRTSYESTPFLGGADESALTIICKWKSDTCATSKSL
jgi:hypothetical protein